MNWINDFADESKKASGLEGLQDMPEHSELSSCRSMYSDSGRLS